MASVMPKMTRELVRELCKEKGLWEQPHLNKQLFLNYKGFAAIEGLEEYENVRALYLDNNSIAAIGGLERMTSLITLQISNNRITSIGNLGFNLRLRQLSLEHNAIKRVEGLRHLPELEILNLSSNSIASLEDTEEVRHCPRLSNVDVSKNLIEASEDVVEFWAEMGSQLRVLRFHGNPCVREASHYRKRLVNALPQLSYLDDRPVFPVERRACKAWAEGGVESMQKARQDFQRERDAETALDDETRAKISKNLKLAYARLDRERREKEEREAAEADDRKARSNGKLVDGDEKALKDYTESWEKKVNLHGIDGVRKQAAKDVGGPRGVAEAEEAARKAQADAPRRGAFAFEPAPREPPERLPTAADSDSAAPKRRAPASSVADFRAPAALDGEFGGESIQERQFAVLGEDIWQGTAGIATGDRKAPRPAGDDLVPDMWKRGAEERAAEEQRALDQNMANSRASRPVATPARSELEALD